MTTNSFGTPNRTTLEHRAWKAQRSLLDKGPLRYRDLGSVRVSIGELAAHEGLDALMREFESECSLSVDQEDDLERIVAHTRSNLVRMIADRPHDLCSVEVHASHRGWIYTSVCLEIRASCSDDSPETVILPLGRFVDTHDRWIELLLPGVEQSLINEDVRELLWHKRIDDAAALESPPEVWLDALAGARDQTHADAIREGLTSRFSDLSPDNEARLENLRQHPSFV